MNAAELDVLGSPAQAYRRLFELGRGGMARVYLAESQAFGVRKLVVQKVLNPEFCEDSAVRAAFRREAELSAQMNHPNVVQVLAVIEDAGAPIIVLEYLDGTPLSAVLKLASQPLSLRLSMYVLSQILAGLHHLHELKDLDGKSLNAVHRDVSPQNVMLLHDGPVKLLDFGIAKVTLPDGQATRAGTIKGKLQYMAPEQLLGSSHVDRRADIFPVGVMLWEAAARRRMWEGKTEVELLRCLATGAVPSLRDSAPGVPQSVLEIVERSTRFDRNQRFATALEMRAALDRALTQEGWLVQPRELAEFMSQHFGEARRNQEKTIQAKLRELRGAADSSGMYTASRPIAGRHSLSTVRISGDVSGSRPAPSRRWSWALAATGVLSVLGGWTLWQRSLVPRDAPASQAPKTVLLEVEALPRGAEIVLGGRSIGRDHYSGEQPQNDAKVLLEVRAPGYLSQRRQVSFGRDMSLQFVLKADPASARSAPSPVASNEHASPLQSESPKEQSAPRGRARATAKAGSPSSGGTSRNCNPPYTFSADGVKTYRPECF